MQRVLWKGVISFGLINIPVNLSAAEDPSELDLDLLDRRDMAPVGYKRVNKETGAEVPPDQIVKGYEYEDGRYVLLSDEDLKKANVKATQTVDLFAFVDQQDIALVHYEKPYYLAPGKRAEKGYALLRETLRRSGKVGIARVVIRSKQHLAALVPMDDMLVLELLRYAEEIRPLSAYDLPASDLKKVGVSEKELQMALSLVEGMSEKWTPQDYHDTFHDDVMRMIDERVKAGATEQITEPDEAIKEAPAGGDVVDFMALLKKSIAAKKTDPADDESAAKKEPDKKLPIPATPEKTAPAKKPRRARA